MLLCDIILDADKYAPESDGIEVWQLPDDNLSLMRRGEILINRKGESNTATTLTGF